MVIPGSELEEVFVVVFGKFGREEPVEIMLKEGLSDIDARN